VRATTGVRATATTGVRATAATGARATATTGGRATAATGGRATAATGSRATAATAGRAAPATAGLRVAPAVPDSRAVEWLVDDGAVRPGGDLLPGAAIVPDADLLPVLPALAELLPAGGLRRGSVVSAGPWSLLCLALAAEATSSGAWCAAAGLPELGLSAAVDAGLDPARLLLIPELGPNWHQVVMSLLDGCDLVLLAPPDRPPAQVRRKLEAAARRHGAVLLVAGEWHGGQVQLRVTSQDWAGIGDGHGRLRARRSQVIAEGRGSWSRPRARWLWLPGPDGSVTTAGTAAEVTTGGAVAWPEATTG
jgi:hypothetical protein